ncbi:hypothetical protein EMIT0P218_410009 [Pseudomonas sp. IT-P218]
MLHAITAGGELHPALRTFCCQIVWQCSVFITYFLRAHRCFRMIVIEFSVALGLIIHRLDRSNPFLNTISCLRGPSHECD